MNYAYGRVSAKDQKLERQLDAFQRCGIRFDRIFTDKKSGKDFERREYDRMIKKVKYHRLSRWLDLALQAHGTGGTTRACSS